MKKSITFFISFLLFLLVVLAQSDAIFRNVWLYQKNANISANDAKTTIDYLTYQNTNLTLNNITQREISHMQDVRQVIFYLSIFEKLILILFCYLVIKYRENITQILFYSGIMLVTSCLLIVLVSLINFQIAFYIFHFIFFKSGTWTFNSDSVLITTFPGTFFLNCFLFVFGFCLFYGILFIIPYFFEKYFNRKKIRD